MTDAAILVCIFVAALLFASVGQAGASGYLAVMTLFRISPDSIRPAVLILNILVAIIGTIQFHRAGYFSWRLFWPFALSAVPCAFLGGTIVVPGHIYDRLVAVILIFSALRLFTREQAHVAKPVSILTALLCGAGIGLLSGLTGTGGGIFLAPLLLFKGWADTKQTAATCSAFILTNSIAGLLGLATKGLFLPAQLPYWCIAAVVGGVIGGELGSRRFADSTLPRIMAVVLFLVGLRLLVL